MSGPLTAKLSVTVAHDGDMSLFLENEDGENEVVATGLPEVVAPAAFEALGKLLAHARERRGASPG